MNYTLAKELKDAGFPQVWPQPDFMEIRDALIVDDIRKKYPEQFDPYRPDLEELIEACVQTPFVKLWRNQKTGQGAVQEEGQSLDVMMWYPTLTEAVARLWLALNKKV